MIPLGEIIDVMTEGGYDGWYVLEQDMALSGELPAVGAGPIVGIKESIAFIKHHIGV
jgi:inosose dehydratase